MFGKRAAKKAAAEPVVELTPFQKAAQERAILKPFENSQYWVCGDYAIHYRVDKAAGKEKGKVFVLHGFWMNTMFYDELVEKLNAEGYTVYRVDMPSFGYSTRETKGIDYVPTKDVIAKMIADLDDGKGFILYGHSMGGSVAMEVALLAPKHVEALVLNAPMFMRNSTDAQAERFTQDRMVKLLTLEANVIKRLNAPIKLFMYAMSWDKDYAKSFDAKRFTAPFADPNAGESLGFFTGHGAGAVCGCRPRHVRLEGRREEGPQSTPEGNGLPSHQGRRPLLPAGADRPRRRVHAGLPEVKAPVLEQPKKHKKKPLRNSQGLFY